MFLTTVFIICTITCGFAVIQVIDHDSLGKYVYNIGEIKTYLQYQRLSPAIFKKVWNYYLLLWKIQNGEHFPAFINNATNYLKEDIMYDIYSHHLLNHFLLKNTHVDFLRQLMAHFKKCMFPKSYVIAEKGDIDCCMYFIHSGTVSVIVRNKYVDDELYTLNKNQSFGELQGLICSKHKYTYIAKTHVDIIMLNKNDWGYLLKFFPATVEEILEKVHEHFGISNIKIDQ
ncbi:PREDICTED: uncharacterized protein LOC108563283 [Nicrophorus vespilloides]|uniref:Uncharacterized protein LOC108563283 n=1 Tax=Nicrophorus vespilloides TaxID=110193 RepID=A0ABM1MS50_NICVS|nr:PREDICTED: uncharacterized protein LOC108563283 [Nicrophorus vespilloides]XP_017777399.1 PREDICTED: uncharacterized protein LOC108563283 [Nicrophorus vespilloides]XP_017777400.1 PREDICTED: uncharacterized protein LOC108563283 [Nicrophorus vespilloides]XP_017777401.1 PREDICTED: uncharacterized protein LOC108563283 [Nicrophorus vespilloides]